MIKPSVLMELVMVVSTAFSVGYMLKFALIRR